MATKKITTTEYTDDLDGGPAVGTVSFSYDGTSYEIDLSKKNKTAMDKALKPYLAAARKVRGTRPPRARGKASSNGSGQRSDLAEVRRWAAVNGHIVSGRGRIPAAVVEAYNAATDR